MVRKIHNYRLQLVFRVIEEHLDCCLQQNHWKKKSEFSDCVSCVPTFHVQVVVLVVGNIQDLLKTQCCASQCNYSPPSDLFQSDQIHQLAVLLVLYATSLYYNSFYPIIFQLAGVASFYKICPKPEEPTLQTTVYYKGADSVSCDSQSDFESPTHPQCFTLNLTCNWTNIPESLGEGRYILGHFSELALAWNSEHLQFNINLK